ncbi:hypothetical protein ACFVWL_15875 [Microbacterium sp. NPDC058269]|uniref:hypothetical protein n=1 Tax=Microbacterium sp. NPDC058269 TaxID=3346414 RepID=UPI0036DF874B
MKLHGEQNADVTLHRYPDASHGLAASAALAHLLSWLPTLYGERPPTGSCS